MTEEEQKQLDYLKNRKEELMLKYLGACEAINEQIRDVKRGVWLEAMNKSKK